MPEPAADVSATPPMWPEALPNPQGDSITVTGPQRVEVFNPLIGPTRLRVRARTAPMEYGFECHLTQQQMQDFETWYCAAARDNDGEFYARWIGGSRIVAFVAPYEYQALGTGYRLAGHLVRTRIDPTACDAFINIVFGAIYRDEGTPPDVYRADLAAADIYADDFDLHLIDVNEC